ncbi:hypothetical protein [Bowmanella denitrificans]|uniref:hypothetical protein n=1 Tax=Bowmanella denitrificans TaxID=366582 RepID=UPI000C9AEA14|nr:hypothetical protein [Bowmanella denitrificans]
MRVLPRFLALFFIGTATFPVLSADFTLVWEPVTGASHYKVQEKVNGTWQDASSSAPYQTALSFAVKGRNTGKFTFRVGGCVQEPGVAVHCGEQVAVYSNELTVDASKNTGERRVIFVHTDLLGNPAAETAPVSN